MLNVAFLSMFRDYMERFLDEQENPTIARPERASSPTNSLLYTDPKRHHPVPSADGHHPVPSAEGHHPVPSSEGHHPVPPSSEGDKPASPEEVAEAMELVTKVVDPNAIFSPIKNSIDFHHSPGVTAVQASSPIATASVGDLPGYATAATTPSAPHNPPAQPTSVCISPELREGKSAENIVHIASIDTAPGDVGGSPSQQHQQEGVASEAAATGLPAAVTPTTSSSLPSASPPSDSSSMNGMEPACKRLKTSHHTGEPISVSCAAAETTDSVVAKVSVLSPVTPQSPKSLSRVKGLSEPENGDNTLQNHVGGNLELSINSLSNSIEDKSLSSSQRISPEATVRQSESIVQ